MTSFRCLLCHPVKLPSLLTRPTTPDLLSLSLSYLREAFSSGICFNCTYMCACVCIYKLPHLLPGVLHFRQLLEASAAVN